MKKTRFLKYITLLITSIIFNCQKDLDIEYTFKFSSITENDYVFIGDEVNIDLALLGNPESNFSAVWKSDIKGEFYYLDEKIDRNKSFNIIPGETSAIFIPSENTKGRVNIYVSSRGEEKSDFVEFTVRKFDFKLNIPEVLDVIAGKEANFIIDYESQTDKYNSSIKYTISDETGNVINTYKDKTLSNPYKLSAEEKLNVSFDYPDKLGTYVILWEYENDLGDNIILKTKINVKGFDYNLNIPEELEVTAGNELDFAITHVSETSKYNSKLSYSLSNDESIIVNTKLNSKLSNPIILSKEDELKLKFDYPSKTGKYIITWEYVNDLGEKNVYKTKINVKAFDYTLDIPESIEVVAGDKVDFSVIYNTTVKKYEPTLAYSIIGSGGKVINTKDNVELSNPYDLTINSIINLNFDYPNKAGNYTIVWEYNNKLGDQIIKKTNIVIKSFDYSIEVPELIEVSAGDKVNFDFIYKSSTNKYTPQIKYSFNDNNSKLLVSSTDSELENPYILDKNETLGLEFKYPSKEGEYSIIWEYKNDFGDLSIKKTIIKVKSFNYSIEVPELIEVNAGDKVVFDFIYKSSTNKYNPKFEYSFSNSDSKLINAVTSEVISSPYNLDSTENLKFEFLYPNKSGEYSITWNYTNDFGDNKTLKTIIKVNSFNYTITVPEIIEVNAGNIAKFNLVYKSSTSKYNPKIKYSLSNNSCKIFDLITSEEFSNPHNLKKDEAINLELKYPNQSGEYSILWEYENDFGDTETLKTIVKVNTIEYDLKVPEIIKVKAGNKAEFKLVYKSSTGKYKANLNYSFSDSSSSLINSTTSKVLANPYSLKQEEILNLEYNYPSKAGEYIVIWEYKNEFGDTKTLKTKIIVEGFDFKLNIPENIEFTGGESPTFKVNYSSSTGKYNPVLKYSISDDKLLIKDYIKGGQLKSPYKLKKDEEIEVSIDYPNKSGTYIIVWEYENDLGNKVTKKTKIIVNSFNYNFEVPQEVYVYAGQKAKFDLIHNTDSNKYIPNVSYEINNNECVLYNYSKDKTLESPYDLSLSNIIKLELRYPKKIGSYIITWKYDSGFGDIEVYSTKITVKELPFSVEYTSENQYLVGTYPKFSLKINPSQQSNQKYKIKKIEGINISSTPKLLKYNSSTSNDSWKSGTVFPSNNLITGYYKASGLGENRGVKITVEDEYGNTETVSHLYKTLVKVKYRSTVSKERRGFCETVKRRYLFKRHMYIKNENKLPITNIEVDGKVYNVPIEPGSENSLQWVSSCYACGKKNSCNPRNQFSIRVKIDGEWSKKETIYI